MIMYRITRWVALMFIWLAQKTNDVNTFFFLRWRDKLQEKILEIKVDQGEFK